MYTKGLLARLFKTALRRFILHCFHACIPLLRTRRPCSGAEVAASREGYSNKYPLSRPSPPGARSARGLDSGSPLLLFLRRGAPPVRSHHRAAFTGAEAKGAYRASERPSEVLKGGRKCRAAQDGASATPGVAQRPTTTTPGCLLSRPGAKRPPPLGGLALTVGKGVVVGLAALAAPGRWRLSWGAGLAPPLFFDRVRGLPRPI